MGVAPKSSMYLRETPVCFLSACAKMSSTRARGTQSASRTPPGGGEGAAATAAAAEGVGSGAPTGRRDAWW